MIHTARGPFHVVMTWHNAGPRTVWGCLAARLGREPTNAEAAAEVRRILSEGAEERFDTHSKGRPTRHPTKGPLGFDASDLAQ